MEGKFRDLVRIELEYVDGKIRIAASLGAVVKTMIIDGKLVNIESIKDGIDMLLEVVSREVLKSLLNNPSDNEVAIQFGGLPFRVRCLMDMETDPIILISYEDYLKLIDEQKV